jgi:Uma2 family endonuclease
MVSTATAPQRMLPKASKTYTLREYLEREERSQHKHEFHNGKIVRMPGGKLKHNIIAQSCATAIKIAIKTQTTEKFLVANSDQKIYIKEINRGLYPDALVICKTPQYWEDREDLIVNPLVIVEVSSKSTREYDRNDKFFLYETLPSFREYVLIEQDKAEVETWFRIDQDTWNKRKQTDINGSIELRALGVTIDLADIYEDIVFGQRL